MNILDIKTLEDVRHTLKNDFEWDSCASEDRIERCLRVIEGASVELVVLRELARLVEEEVAGKAEPTIRELVIRRALGKIEKARSV